MPMLLAHGALGAFDEILLIGIGGAFVVMMVVSWLKARNLDADETPDAQPDPLPATPPAAPSDADHIPLR
jgi:hypothetical protein